MKFTIENPPKENIYNLMRKAGYFFQKEDKEKEEFSFTRPARGYPRFHLFLKIKNKSLIFSLHLDQKKPIYKGTTTHSGEYNSEIVKEEAKRIDKLLSGF